MVDAEWLRQELRRRQKSRTQRQFAHMIGVEEGVLSRALNGYGITGKVLNFLGYRKSRIKLYERVRA